MFDELRFSYRIWRNARRDRSLWEKHGEKLREARKRGASREDIREIEADGMFLSKEIDDTIARMLSRHLLDQADKLLIPRPEFKEGDTYVESEFSSGYHLSPTAVAALRDAIRKERRERSEITRLWMIAIGGIIGALTGLIGTTIGLLAYLDKLHR